MALCVTRSSETGGVLSFTLGAFLTYKVPSAKVALMAEPIRAPTCLTFCEQETSRLGSAAAWSAEACTMCFANSCLLQGQGLL